MSRSNKSITLPLGFKTAGLACGIKPSGKPDLALIAADVPCRVAAVFTKNAIPSQPIPVAKKHVARGPCRAIICNAGIANSSTGSRGTKDALAICAAVAKELDCKPTEIIACSTGVIGEFLPMPKVLKGINAIVPKLADSPAADARASRAILTTDLVPKTARKRLRIGGKNVALGGIAKGSGMIAPNMATMFGFITTDVDITTPLLRSALKQAVNADASFNRISIDTDTSPSDTVAVLASGLAGNRPIRTRNADYRKFTEALTDICRDLSYQIIADGEGVTRVIRVIVKGARTEPQAVKLARIIADSPLIKTAVNGGDPNWGRLTMAIGKSGVPVNPKKLNVKIGPITVYRAANPVKADTKRLQKLMTQDEVAFHINLNQGKASCEFLGCDLSRQYVTINADYHT